MFCCAMSACLDILFTASRIDCLTHHFTVSRCRSAFLPSACLPCQFFFLPSGSSECILSLCLPTYCLSAYHPASQMDSLSLRLFSCSPVCLGIPTPRFLCLCLLNYLFACQFVIVCLPVLPSASCRVPLPLAILSSATL